MKKNLTYKKRPTKYQRAKRDKNVLLGIAILVFTIFSCSNALISVLNAKKLPQSEIKGISYQLTQENSVAVANLDKKTSSSTNIEVIEYKLITNKPEVEMQIRKIADDLNFKWPDYLVKLAQCESQLRPDAVNVFGNNPATSKDRGLFQFNSHWQKKVSDECAFSVECATKKTIEMINRGDQGLWACDKIVKKK